MATKTIIQNLINTLIRSNPALIDKTEHADVEDALLNNAYGTTVREKHNTTNTITTANTGQPTLLYDLFINKQGRKVRIKGTITNNSTSIIGAPFWFCQITNSEYLQDTTMDSLGLTSNCSVVSGNNVDVFLNDNKLATTIMGAYQVAYVDIEYLTQN